ncbi:MAG: hypothetical protein H6974_04995 [Gammaproteobacteria bacterium]|nr:hypothetical protein [Gammaproteobacteria bacterium]MCP5196138.1 hypothetical protein [Gammaproteobacteria bacterium]
MAELTRHELQFQARMNIRYHENLERRYGNWLNWTSFVSFILSSAAFIALLETIPYKSWIVAGIALIAALLNGAVLAFGMLGKFSLHADLKRQWILLLSRLQTTPDDRLVDIETELHALNAREPAAERRWLNQAYEETCTALDLHAVPHTGGR